MMQAAARPPVGQYDRGGGHALLLNICSQQMQSSLHTCLLLLCIAVCCRSPLAPSVSQYDWGGDCALCHAE
jgi:hypothetical protein